MSLEIRRIDDQDIAAFRAIRFETLTEEPAAFASTVDDWLALSEEEWRRRAVENPVLVAFDSGAPIGIMGLLLETSTQRKHRAMLVMVYVRKARRGSGLAERLLEATLEEARRLGVRQVELHVVADNDAAIGFYRRQGFAEFGRLPNAVLRNGQPSGELLMARQIGPL